MDSLISSNAFRFHQYFINFSVINKWGILRQITKIYFNVL